MPSKPHTDTAQVKLKAIELGEFTRRQLIDAMTHMEEKAAAQAVDQLIHVHNDIKLTRRDPSTSKTGRAMVAVYTYIGASTTELLAKELPQAAAMEPPICYEPGYFTALMREHNWPPEFTSRLRLGAAPVGLLQTVQRRESDSATGKGWGSGTCVMPGSSIQLRPQMMERAA